MKNMKNQIEQFKKLHPTIQMNEEQFTQCFQDLKIIRKLDRKITKIIKNNNTII